MNEDEKSKAEPDDDPVVWGALAIGQTINRNLAQTNYLLERGRLAAARAGIDRAYATDDPRALLVIADDQYTPMEARQLAKARILALHEQVTERREIRPDIDLLRVKASALGYGWPSVTIWSANWR
jgi:hypothetical protein